MEDDRNIPLHLFKRALQRDNGPGWIRVAWRPLALGNDGAAPRLLPFSRYTSFLASSSTFFFFVLFFSLLHKIRFNGHARQAIVVFHNFNVR